jgi:hypothetical protein
MFFTENNSKVFDLSGHVIHHGQHDVYELRRSHSEISQSTSLTSDTTASVYEHHLFRLAEMPQTSIVSFPFIYLKNRKAINLCNLFISNLCKTNLPKKHTTIHFLLFNSFYISLLYLKNRKQSICVNKVNKNMIIAWLSFFDYSNIIGCFFDTNLQVFT